MHDNDGIEIDPSELEDDFNEEEFEIGFNQGYTIAELDPDLALELDNGVVEHNSLSSGFAAGIKEFLRFLEVQKSREDELSVLRNQNQDRDRSR